MNIFATYMSGILSAFHLTIWILSASSDQLVEDCFKLTAER
jgi:hypothetical protein